MTLQSYHRSRVKSKSFVFISKRLSSYAGRCSGADRRLRTRPRNMSICNDFSTGARIKDISKAVRMHRNSIRYILNRDLHNFLKRWEHFRKKIAGLKKAMHNELPPSPHPILQRWIEQMGRLRRHAHRDVPCERAFSRDDPEVAGSEAEIGT